MLDVVISLLFFDSLPAAAVLAGAYPFYRRITKDLILKKELGEVRGQFLDAMQITGANLQTGYSIENAVSETVSELKRIYPEDACMVREFSYMRTQLALNRTAEELFLSLAERYRVEEIETFAQLFQTTRRTGGDLVLIVRNTAVSMRQRMETSREIETILSGKVMEQNVMSLMPLVILAYVRLSSPEFIRPVYHNPAGICVMSICLAVYAAAWMWGRKIVDIRV